MVFGLFGSKVERLKKAVRQRYGQHEPRKDAMMRLLQMADLEAYRAVLSRFTVNCDSPHWDEKEKTWLAARLLERQGDAALLQALQELLMTGERLNQALRERGRQCVHVDSVVQNERARRAKRGERHATGVGAAVLCAKDEDRGSAIQGG